jgi:hypothetical protein
MPMTDEHSLVALILVCYKNCSPAFPSNLVHAMDAITLCLQGVAIETNQDEMLRLDFISSPVQLSSPVVQSSCPVQ